MSQHFLNTERANGTKRRSLPVTVWCCVYIAGEREKDSSYKDIVSENGGVFYPLVVKSLGL